MKAFLSIALVFAAAAVPAAVEPQTIDVVLGSYYIKPEVIRVRVNQPVTLKIRNEAKIVPHDLVIDAPEAGMDIKTEVAAGDVASVTFTPTRTGSFRTYCDKKLPLAKSHREKGMQGWVEVVQ